MHSQTSFSCIHRRVFHAFTDEFFMHSHTSFSCIHRRVFHAFTHKFFMHSQTSFSCIRRRVFHAFTHKFFMHSQTSFSCIHRQVFHDSHTSFSCIHRRVFHAFTLEFFIHSVRVLSLRSSVIHGFVTEHWYSRHVWVSYERVASSVFESCALSSAYIVLCGVWCLDPGTHVLSFGSCRGSDTRAPFSVIVWVRSLEFARHRTLLSTCVLLCCTQFVFLSAACIYVMSCKDMLITC